MHLVTSQGMRDLEERAAERGIPAAMLMGNAGISVALSISERLGSLEGRRCLVLCGPGNNGGDGLVTAHYLRRMGATVFVALWKRQHVSWTINAEGRLIHVGGYGGPHADDRAPMPQLPILGADHAHTAGPPVTIVQDVALFPMETMDVIVDALLGTGLGRPLEGYLRDICQDVNNARRDHPGLLVLAVDLPTGVDADTGAVDEAAIQADVTVALGYPKLGLALYPGAAHAGALTIGHLGLPQDLAIPGDMVLLRDRLATFPPRPAQSHKGTYGKVLAVAGSLKYPGAAIMTSEAAARVGAGLVTLLCPQGLLQTYGGKVLEVTLAPVPEEEHGVLGPSSLEAAREYLKQYDVLLIGPGLGRHKATREFIYGLLRGAGHLQEDHPGHPAVVIDADALDALAQASDWPALLPANCVLTPHPGEMGRLVHKRIAADSYPALEELRRCARAWSQVVVLKGAHTMVGHPRGRVAIHAQANPALATAGSGDVLAGAIAGLLAQGLTPSAAAESGVLIHAMAGELARADLGDAGVVASDLLPRLPLAIRALKRAHDLP